MVSGMRHKAVLVLGFVLLVMVTLACSSSPADTADTAYSRLPLLQERGMVNGRPTAYVCRNYACQLPVTEPEALAAQLEE